MEKHVVESDLFLPEDGYVDVGGNEIVIPVNTILKCVRNFYEWDYHKVFHGPELISVGSLDGVGVDVWVDMRDFTLKIRILPDIAGPSLADGIHPLRELNHFIDGPEEGRELGRLQINMIY